MMKKLHPRLARLERQSNRAPAMKNIEEMSDQELLKLAGLPPDAGDEDIETLVKSFEHDLVVPRTCSPTTG
jgi:hypothetical protein